MDETIRDGMDMVREEGEELSERVSDVAGEATDKLPEGWNYLRHRDLTGIAEDTKGLVRRYPGTSLIVAAVVGFLAAHCLRSGGPQDTEYEL